MLELTPILQELNNSLGFHYYPPILPVQGLFAELDWLDADVAPCDCTARVRFGPDEPG